MDKVVHFEIPADKEDRAKKFYNKVFGWDITPVPEMGYTMLQTGPTDKKGMAKDKGFINGGMMKRKKPMESVMITISVEDIDNTNKKIVKMGGKVVGEKLKIGEMGYIQYFKDSEGNMIGLWENMNDS